MGNKRFRETPLIDDALESVAMLLPASWHIDKRQSAFDDHRFDAVVELTGPTDEKATFVVEARQSMPVPLLIPALRELERTSGMPVLFVSDYIGPPLRDALTSAEFSFADATGWVRMTSTSPLVLLTGQGAARAPRPPRSSAVTRLNGLAASRTIRVLATADLPIGIRDLAILADVSPGSVSKLMTTLTAEGIVDRDGTGRVLAVSRRALLRRWVLDYSFAKTNSSVGYYIAPRGLERTLLRLAEEKKVAITGSAAARRLLPETMVPVVPLRLLAIYATQPTELADNLKLIDGDPTTTNVVIARPQDPELLAPPHDDHLTTAPLPLVIADLLTLPGRSDAEAEQLMDALADNNEAWRERP
ncbi:helix-turn-helix domain-containing protein [Nocardia macrotermitis]|uniref:HTH iclR-type domain-containing protein n=1 Tax=Nocardia macrotermitis TaxID=2585198 RepID=A0A7K0D1N0_9NOCA|nr:helix-turn-helix domain-containing protein [Nocardia macrotermitis]MQY19607.1 hypothetical protein [Nocardia macrotermitis]